MISLTREIMREELYQWLQEQNLPVRVGTRSYEEGGSYASFLLSAGLTDSEQRSWLGDFRDNYDDAADPLFG